MSGGQAADALVELGSGVVATTATSDLSYLSNLSAPREGNLAMEARCVILLALTKMPLVGLPVKTTQTEHVLAIFHHMLPPNCWLVLVVDY